MNSETSTNDEPAARRNSRANLDRLLTRLIEYPERHEQIARSIEDIFGQEKAVMVLDMSGFARTTQQHGIVWFLLMIHQMQLVARPCIEAQGGLVVKSEADNIFCLFETVASAVHAAREINDNLNSANKLLPEDRRLCVSIGIGCGRILNLEDRDIFGDEVNLSSKLGEDVAGDGDILLTNSAAAQLAGTDIKTHEQMLCISDLTLTYYSVDP
jgi:class 3 adenylate cyclase